MITKINHMLSLHSTSRILVAEQVDEAQDRTNVAKKRMS